MQTVTRAKPAKRATVRRPDSVPARPLRVSTAKPAKRPSVRRILSQAATFTAQEIDNDAPFCRALMAYAKTS